MIEWQDKFCLGVDKIDRQHQELFRAVNRVIRIVDEGDMERNARACGEAIKYLKNYTLMHFQDEEAYQLEIGYPGYDRHKAAHDAFRASIPEREAAMEAQGYSRDAVLDFVQVLTAWLLNHIMKEDQAIVRGGDAV